MTRTDTTVYLVDTSVWIRLHEEKYPPDVFPTLYKELNNAGVNGRIKSPRQVLGELGDKDSGVGAWVRSIQPSIVLRETGRVARLAGAIIEQFPGLVKRFTGEEADPFLVAWAIEHGYHIVTEEHRTVMSSRASVQAKKVKIPDVCHARNLTYTDTLGLLRNLKIKI